MKSSVEQIKERLSIVDVVGSYIKLEGSGSNYKARCPFHNEKTPSFFVSPDRGSFYCFGCGAKGDIFSFVEDFEGLDFLGSLKVLADRAGVVLKFENQKEKTEREKLYAVLEEAANFFDNKLKSNGAAKEYLKGRGVKDETIIDFRIGYAPDSWRELMEYLTGRGISVDALISAGLIKKTQKGVETTYYDTFRRRIMFPISDSAGRIVAFSGRIFPEMSKDENEMPKYVNSPETEVFDKSSILFGYDRAKGDIRKKDYCLLVEGQFDLIMCHQAGYRNAVATSGTALTAGHLEKIKRLTENLLMAFDGDKAGISASKRAVSLALSQGLNVKIAHLENGLDPADLIKQDEKSWKKVISESKYIVDFYVDTLLQSNLPPHTFSKEVRKSILPLIKMIKSPIDLARHVKSLSFKCDIREESLWEELKGITENYEEPVTKENPVKKKVLSRSDSIEAKIAGIIFSQEQKENTVIDISEVKERLNKIAGERNRDRIEAMYKMDKEALSLKAEILYQDDTVLLKEIQDLLNLLEEQYLKEEFVETMEKLSKAEKIGNQGDIEKILQKCTDISSRLNTLKTSS
ncbi:MAG: DNA primase [Parcubacteria group bacterium CG11_big_fil_rev_8_21_14_0_20_39_22]|nr:MAG: DNA primase [Parcubacteria group bacterium CG11_big_fil_rev_8_21_14_0_20_39_22]